MTHSLNDWRDKFRTAGGWTDKGISDAPEFVRKHMLELSQEFITAMGDAAIRKDAGQTGTLNTSPNTLNGTIMCSIYKKDGQTFCKECNKPIMDYSDIKEHGALHARKEVSLNRWKDKQGL